VVAAITAILVDETKFQIFYNSFPQLFHIHGDSRSLTREMRFLIEVGAATRGFIVRSILIMEPSQDRIICRFSCDSKYLVLPLPARSVGDEPRPNSRSYDGSRPQSLNLFPFTAFRLLGGRGCVRHAAAEGGRPEVRHGLPPS
jgi:hypothetical protein